MSVVVFSYIDPLGKTVLFEADADLSRTHRFESAITDYPVEDGSAMSDHVVLRPIGISLELLVSDSPVGSQGKTYPVGLTTQQSRSQQAYDALLRLRTEKALLDVWTPFRAYERMLITSIDIPEDGAHAGGLYARVELREVTLAQSQAVMVTALQKKRKRAPTLAELDKEALAAGAEARKNLDRFNLERLEAEDRRLELQENLDAAKTPAEKLKLYRKSELEDARRAAAGSS